MNVTQTVKVPKIIQHIAENCPECTSKNLIHDADTGETICGDCGLVLYDQMMDKGPEWRSFTQQEKASRSRVGMPSSYSIYDKGLSTTITQIDKDAFGKKLPLSTRLQMWRLRKWQIRSRVHSSIDRNLSQAMSTLDRICGNVNISPPIKEKAALIYRKALEKGLVRGRSISGVVAASLYAACRKSGLPRSLSEIAEASLVNKKEIGRCYRLLLKELDFHMPVSEPLTFISKIAEKNSISGKTQGVAIAILREARTRRVASGKDPMGMAAASLYIACLQNNEKITQKDIADAAGVTEVTIRNRYKALMAQLTLVVPNKTIFQNQNTLKLKSYIPRGGQL